MISFIISSLETEEQKSKFEKIYTLYKSNMMAVAMSILHNEYDAEEALYNALFYISRIIDSLDLENSIRLKSYLNKAVKNAAFDILRKKKNTPIIENIDYATHFPVKENIDDIIASNEQYSNLVKTIYNMPYIYRDVLILNLVHELSPRKISILLNKNINTVKSNIARGKKILKAAIEEIDKQ